MRQELHQQNGVRTVDLAADIAVSVAPLLAVERYCTGNRLIQQYSVCDIHSAVYIHISVEDALYCRCGGCGPRGDCRLCGGLPRCTDPDRTAHRQRHARHSYAVLHQLQDPGNAGMILRTADALGLDGVIYSASCDIYSPKVVRATMGSLFRVPLCCVPEIEPVLAACRDAGVESCAAVVSGQAELVGQCLFRKGTAVVIGNEGNGLPEEVSAACDRRVTIPMHGTIESLNAAMAAGIILWEVQKAAAAGNGGQ